MTWLVRSLLAFLFVCLAWAQIRKDEAWAPRLLLVALGCQAARLQSY